MYTNVNYYLIPIFSIFCQGWHRAQRYSRYLIDLGKGPNWKTFLADIRVFTIPKQNFTSFFLKKNPMGKTLKQNL